MGKIIELTHDDVQNELAYALICVPEKVRMSYDNYLL